MTEYNYIPESQLVEWTYYYVHNYYTKNYTSNKPKVDIRQYAGNGNWINNGLGNAGRWLALEEVPELNITKYEVQNV